MKNEKIYLFVDDYGDMLAQVNQMELVSFEQDGGYQGEYCAIITDGKRLFYYIDSYGSCSGCDWLEDMGNNYSILKDNKRYAVELKEAINFCGGLKPTYIVPKDKPLKIKTKGEYEGFEVL